MSGLLSAAEDREIRDAVKLVTDTFMVTPVVLKRKGKVLDRWEEDRAASWTSINLSGLVGWESGQEEVVMEGSKDFGDLKITFNVEDLQTLNLITADFGTVIEAEKDYVIVKNKVYAITDVMFDGPLSNKDCLLVMMCKLSEKGVNGFT